MKYISDRVKTGAVLAAIILSGMLILNCCKSQDDQFADSKYAEFKEKILNDTFNEKAVVDAAFIATNHYDINKKLEAQRWLDTYKKREDDYIANEKREKEEIENRIKGLGGYKMIEIDSKSKCNLLKGYYKLNKVVKDSSDLAFIAEYLGSKLFQSGKTDTSCPYKNMAQVFIYQPTNNIYEDHWASMYMITPSNYEGDVFVNKELK